MSKMSSGGLPPEKEYDWIKVLGRPESKVWKNKGHKLSYLTSVSFVCLDLNHQNKNIDGKLHIKSY